MTHLPHDPVLISLQDCMIETHREIIFTSLDWKMCQGEAWLVTGPNGGGKSILASALAGELSINPCRDGFYSNIFILR